MNSQSQVSDNNEYEQIMKWLCSLNYTQYVPIFFKNRLDSWNKLYSLDRNHLISLGILRGHAVRICNRLIIIKQHNQQQNNPIRSILSELNTLKRELNANTINNNQRDPVTVTFINAINIMIMDINDNFNFYNNNILTNARLISHFAELHRLCDSIKLYQNQRKIFQNQVIKVQKMVFDAQSDKNRDIKKNEDVLNNTKFIKQGKPNVNLNDSSLDKLIRTLPTVGYINESESYWSIKLTKNWQSQSLKIQNASLNAIKNTKEYLESIQISKKWALMIHDKNPIIQCVIPPSTAGFHISLGTWKKGDISKPKCLIAQHKVLFNLTNVRTFPTHRSYPTNLPGQYTTNDGLRYYPVLWIMADIDFIDFKFNTKYPPHISLSCIAVQLKVNKVKALGLQWFRYNDSLNI